MNVNKSELFGRTELLLGKEAMEKIYGTHVAIFGVGGVGGYCNADCEAIILRSLGAAYEYCRNKKNCHE